MKKRGFTLIELLIVLAITGILLTIGGISIKRHSRAQAMIQIKNEIGDFFRIAAKSSLETGKKQMIDFKLEEKIIEIYRVEDSFGKWSNGGTKRIVSTYKLPNELEYAKKVNSTGKYEQTFTRSLTSHGSISKPLTIYVVEKNLTSIIDGSEKVEYAVSFSNTSHIKYLDVREYIPLSTIILDDINKSPSGNEKLELIRN